MANYIPIEVKKKCLELKSNGLDYRDIYESYFKLQFNKPQDFASFRRSMNRWVNSVFPDDVTLKGGTYEGFIAHGATVQVSSSGEIVQAWIKQTNGSNVPEDFLEVLKDRVEKYEYEHVSHDDAENMLEIPLFDMHWGIAFLDYYSPALDEILDIIESKHWEEIIIPFGQDFFHNDSVVNNQTTKGTVVEKVDTKRAVKEAFRFVYALIDHSIKSANKVRVLYSPGNHDQSISWMFMQTLLERYGPEIVDDSMEFRKAFSYGNNAIMVTHGNSKRANPSNLAHIFPISFPDMFSKAKIHEIHAGHLHSESDCDISGVMVRRLSTGNKTDEWTDSEDMVGTIKRFMLFEFSKEKLKTIHYV